MDTASMLDEAAMGHGGGGQRAMEHGDGEEDGDGLALGTASARWSMGTACRRGAAATVAVGRPAQGHGRSRPTDPRD